MTGTGQEKYTVEDPEGQLFAELNRRSISLDFGGGDGRSSHHMLASGNEPSQSSYPEGGVEHNNSKLPLTHQRDTGSDSPNYMDVVQNENAEDIHNEIKRPRLSHSSDYMSLANETVTSISPEYVIVGSPDSSGVQASKSKEVDYPDPNVSADVEDTVDGKGNIKSRSPSEDYVNISSIDGYINLGEASPVVDDARAGKQSRAKKKFSHVMDVIPTAFLACFGYLRQSWALTQTGLFRVPGNRKEIDELFSSLSEDPSLDSLSFCMDEAAVCGLLKRLIFTEWKPFNEASAAAVLNSSKAKHAPVAAVAIAIRGLNSECISILYGIMELFIKIFDTESNQMIPMNLGVSIGPTLFPGVPLDEFGSLMQFMAANHEALWSDWDTGNVDQSIRSATEFYEHAHKARKESKDATLLADKLSKSLAEADSQSPTEKRDSSRFRFSSIIRKKKSNRKRGVSPLETDSAMNESELDFYDSDCTTPFSTASAENRSAMSMLSPAPIDFGDVQEYIVESPNTISPNQTTHASEYNSSIPIGDAHQDFHARSKTSPTDATERASAADPPELPPRLFTKDSPIYSLVEIDESSGNDIYAQIVRVKDSRDNSVAKRTLKSPWSPQSNSIDSNRTTPEVDKVLVPREIRHCIRELSKLENITTQGIFRRSGNKERIDQLRQAFQNGSQDSFIESHDVDPHTLAGLLKEVLRSRKNSVLGTNLYAQWVEIAKLSEDERVVKVRLALHTFVTAENLAILDTLLPFLQRVCDHSLENKMTLENISTVFGPTLLTPPKTMSPLEQLPLVEYINKIIFTLILHQDTILDPISAEGSDFPFETNVMKSSDVEESAFNAKFSGYDVVGGDDTTAANTNPCIDSEEAQEELRKPKKGWLRGLIPKFGKKKKGSTQSSPIQEQRNIESREHEILDEVEERPSPSHLSSPINHFNKEDSNSELHSNVVQSLATNSFSHVEPMQESATIEIVRGSITERSQGDSGSAVYHSQDQLSLATARPVIPHQVSSPKVRQEFAPDPISATTTNLRTKYANPGQSSGSFRSDGSSRGYIVWPDQMHSKQQNHLVDLKKNAISKHREQSHVEPSPNISSEPFLKSLSRQSTSAVKGIVQRSRDEDVNVHTHFKDRTVDQSYPSATSQLVDFKENVTRRHHRPSQLLSTEAGNQYQNPHALSYSQPVSYRAAAGHSRVPSHVPRSYQLPFTESKLSQRFCQPYSNLESRVSHSHPGRLYRTEGTLPVTHVRRASEQYLYVNPVAVDFHDRKNPRRMYSIEGSGTLAVVVHRRKGSQYHCTF